MSGWGAGDLAVCVDAADAPELVEGRVYTVIGVDTEPGVRGLDPDGPDADVGLFLLEAEPGPEFFGYDANRFRKVRPDTPEKCDEEFIDLLDRVKVPA